MDGNVHVMIFSASDCSFSAEWETERLFAQGIGTRV